MKIRTFLMSAALGFYAFKTYHHREKIKEDSNEMDKLLMASQSRLKDIKHQVNKIKIEKYHLDTVLNDINHSISQFKEDSKEQINQIKQHLT